MQCVVQLTNLGRSPNEKHQEFWQWEFPIKCIIYRVWKDDLFWLCTIFRNFHQGLRNSQNCNSNSTKLWIIFLKSHMNDQRSWFVIHKLTQTRHSHLYSYEYNLIEREIDKVCKSSRWWRNNSRIENHEVKKHVLLLGQGWNRARAEQGRGEYCRQILRTHLVLAAQIGDLNVEF